MVIIMIYNSLWLKGINEKILPSLSDNITADVLIIGGGITGISTAFYLRNSNLNVVLVDSNRIGYGVTSKTTGKLTYLQELIYNKIQSNYGFKVAKKYLDSQKYAIELVKSNNVILKAIALMSLLIKIAMFIN